jgi:hypothetical protein
MPPKEKAPNFTIELTREEASFLWDLLAKFQQTPQPLPDGAKWLALSRHILDKANKAAKVAGYPLPGAPI